MMHPEEIKAKLRIRGSSQSQIARDLGVSHTSVSLVIRGRFKSRRIAEAVSRASGLSLLSMFGNAYQIDRRS